MGSCFADVGVALLAVLNSIRILAKNLNKMKKAKYQWHPIPGMPLTEVDKK